MTDVLRRIVPAAALLLALAGAVSAQTQDADALLVEARKLAPQEPARAADLLLTLAGDAGASDGDRVRGVRLAMEVLPLELRNRAAAALVLATLQRNRSQPDAWKLAFRVRDSVIDGLDLVNGEPFLKRLIELYPDQLSFRHYLADLYLDTGRPKLADAQCEEILRQAPDDVFARRVQAPLRELEGQFTEALELYRQIHEISGDLQPLVWRVRILVDPLCDYDGAEAALRDAFAAVERAPAGPARNQARADLEYEETRIQEERARRAQLLGIGERQDWLALLILGGWGVLLGGGLVLLRRRGLV